jgi:hypothetical protein
VPWSQPAAAVVITWNGPLTSLTMKVPPALAAGNTVVVKPSEFTPFAAELFADIVEEAGFPAGTVSVLPGTGDAGAALVEHPLVQKVSFTGGPATARAILRSCSEMIKPTCLELGGKSANLIFEDADLDAALTWNTLRVLGTVSGQGCAFPTRMLVEESVYNEAVDRVADIVKGIRVGDPWDTETDIGPVVNKAAVDRILGMIERAKRDGARLVAGGGRVEGPFANGFYIEPTVFADVDPKSELGQVEVFGPVLSIMPFSSEEEAIEIANSTPYGLGSYIQTNDLRRAHRVAERLVAGNTMINGAPNMMVNRPMGGFGPSIGSVRIMRSNCHSAATDPRSDGAAERLRSPSWLPGRRLIEAVSHSETTCVLGTDPRPGNCAARFYGGGLLLRIAASTSRIAQVVPRIASAGVRSHSLTNRSKLTLPQRTSMIAAAILRSSGVHSSVCGLSTSTSFRRVRAFVALTVGS